MTNCKDVILCKGLSDKNSSLNRYLEIFSTAAFKCRVLPCLSFSFVNRDVLTACMLKTECYSGLVLTSPRAVEAIYNAFREENLPDFWKNSSPAYCVGPSTESITKNLIKLKSCHGSQCGNSLQLAKYITSIHTDKEKPILYPCSAIARDTIQMTLENEKILVEKIVAYETRASETLEENLLDILSGFEQIFIFFSPSIAQFVFQIVDKRGLNKKNIKAVAIGQVTAEALSNLGIEIYALAEKPDPETLLQSVKNAK